MKWNPTVIFILICGWFNSCTLAVNRENRKLMQQAQQLLEQAPDSALLLLDAVNTPPLSKAARAEYTLLRVQARSNANEDISTDTEMVQAWEYLQKKNNAEKAARAGFYAALVANARKDATAELDFYLKTLPFAEKTENKILQGKIYYNMGYIYYGNDLYAEAIAHYRQALKQFQAAGDQYLREITVLNAVANAFMVELHTDSAQLYYRSALNLARLHDDTAKQATIYANKGVAYRELGKMDSAMVYCRKALKLARPEDEKAITYVIIARIHFMNSNLDSARYYIDMAEPSYHRLENKYAQANLAHLYWQIEKTAGNYIKAMEYLETYHQYKDELTNQDERNLLMELQKKYNATTLENEYNREKSLLWKITAFLGCGILLLLRAFFYYQKENEKEKMALEIENKMEKMALEIENKKEIIALEIENKKERMALENENKKERMALKIENKKERMALENENKKEKMALEKMERDKEETEKELIASNILRSRREKELKAAIIDKLDVVKKMAEFGRKIENKTELTHTMLISMANELIEKYTMEKIMESTNELYPNLDSLLENRAQEEKLTEREKCVCHLIACGFDNDDIALFIDRKKSTKTVENWKTTIRKKLGIPSYGDMYKILTEANT